MRVRSILSDERGAGAVMIILLLVVIMGMLALTVDGGLLWVKFREVRRANDAAALAAALECGTSGLQTAADTSANEIAEGNASDVKGVPGSPNAYDPACSASKGTVTVHYGSTAGTGGGVDLMFWPAACALTPGCKVTSPKDVVAQATAVWGFAGGGPVFPLTVSRNRLSTCGIPDSMTEADVGVTRCAFYFDQGRSLSTWGLIDLATWGLPPCSGTPAGNAQYVDWYNTQPTLNLVHDDPASQPTFVCPTPGNRDVLYATNDSNQNSVVARAIASGKFYMFPVNQPCSTAPAPPVPCNTFASNGSLNMYAIIGFAWLKPAEICGSETGPAPRKFDCTGASTSGTTDKTLCDSLITADTPVTSTSRCLVAEWEGFTTSKTDVVVSDSFGNVKITRLIGI